MMRRMEKLLQKTVMMTDPSVRTGRVVTGGTRSTNGISSIPRPQVSATAVILYVTVYESGRMCVFVTPLDAREKQLKLLSFGLMLTGQVKRLSHFDPNGRNMKHRLFQITGRYCLLKIFKLLKGFSG